MVIISSSLPQASSMAVRSTTVAAAVTSGVGRSTRHRSLGGCTSLSMYGMSMPVAASTGSVFGPCVVSSEFTPQEYKEQ